MVGLGSQLSRMLGKAVTAGARSAVRELTKPKRSAPGRTPEARQEPARPQRQPGGYAGDFEGRATLEYAPVDDDLADPGEVVWAWVPFEENDGRGKDRPVLVIARHRGLLLALMLTSKDHDRDAADERRHGRSWLDIGSGAWDRSGRPSEVRIDRVLQLDPAAVRREGAALDRRTYDHVAAEVRRVLGW